MDQDQYSDEDDEEFSGEEYLESDREREQRQVRQFALESQSQSYARAHAQAQAQAHAHAHAHAQAQAQAHAHAHGNAPRGAGSTTNVRAAAADLLGGRVEALGRAAGFAASNGGAPLQLLPPTPDEDLAALMARLEPDKDKKANAKAAKK